MGQQQLLLIILVTLIVGFSTLVALGSVDEAHVEAGKEAIRQDIVRALGDAQTYYFKPETMGGGGRSFTHISMNDLSLEASGPNGEYNISGDQQNLTLVGFNPAVNVRIEAIATIDAKGSMKITWKN